MSEDSKLVTAPVEKRSQTIGVVVNLRMHVMLQRHGRESGEMEVLLRHGKSEEDGNTSGAAARRRPRHARRCVWRSVVALNRNTASYGM